MAEVIPRAGDVVDTGDPRIDFIYEAMERNNEVSVRLERDTEAAIGRQSELTQVMADAIRKAGTSQAIVEETEQLAQLEAQNATIDSVEAAGVKEMQTKLLATYTQQAKMAEDLAAKKQDIMDDQHTGIGLIDTIVNGFRAVQVDTELDVATQRKQQAAAGIQNLAASTSQIASTNASTMRAINEDTIRAKVEFINATTAGKLAELELNSIRSNSQMLGTLAQASGQQLNNILKAYQLEQDAETNALLKAQRQEAADKIRKDTATEEEIVAAWRRGAATLGIEQISDELILYNIQKSRDSSIMQKHSKILEIGADPKAPLGTVIGGTPYEARQTMAVLDPNGQAKPTKASKVLPEVDKRVAEYLAANPGRGKDENFVASKYNDSAVEVMSSFMADIKPGDKSNPYAAPPLDSVVAAGQRTVTSTALYQKVLKDSGIKDTDPQELADIATNAIAAGAVTPDEAAEGLVAIFSTAVGYNNINDGGYRRYGLPNQTSYNVRMPNPKSVTRDLFKDISSGLTSVPLVNTQVLGGTLGLAGSLITEPAEVSINWIDVTQVKNYLVKMKSSGPSQEG